MKQRELLNKGSEILKASGIEYYNEDAILLLSFLLKTDKLNIILNGASEVSAEKSKEFLDLINLRGEKYPLKYITNIAEFMGIDFYVKDGVLIPRADTEVLVEEVIKLIDERGYKNIVDVCSGSGAIGLSIAKHCKVEVDLCDISDVAKEVTFKNIELLGLMEKASFYMSDLLSFAKSKNKKYDVIVSNPPYIKTMEIQNLMVDVKEYEPRIALDGGEDGLYFYREITKNAKEMLNVGGVLAFEIGYDQKDEVVDILLKNYFKDIYYLKDYGNNFRVVIGFK